MKILTSLFCCLFTASVYAQTYKEGLQAAQNKDYEKAYNILQQLAEKDNPYAMRDLGKMYARGDWVEPDMYKAMEWWSRCALTHNFECMTTLGYTRYHVPEVKNIVFSHFWYTLASFSPDLSIRNSSLESLQYIEEKMSLEQIEASGFLLKNTFQSWKGILE